MVSSGKKALPGGPSTVLAFGLPKITHAQPEVRTVDNLVSQGMDCLFALGPSRRTGRGSGSTTFGNSSEDCVARVAGGSSDRVLERSSQVHAVLCRNGDVQRRNGSLRPMLPIIACENIHI